MAILFLGMWGSKLMMPQIRRNWNESWEHFFKESISYHGRNADQYFLGYHIWQWAKQYSLQHDSYFCKYFPNSTGFRTKRLKTGSNFVGAVVPTPELLVECPRECRRDGHEDEWIHC